ncbi:M1 family metallopeptidase [Aureitalea sp. L0-47]|uniref:M1 family metallopeptidase n=1 Tax=Aureitalea sp. L0-47 TaxID=2816962 RepID=UPI0022378504|nr:M1 family metallopeptidase [Aureitalea sp. L0-47]MCW5519746.1 M1 family metallopeptidase [Aureitalea sp. L0-47]
MKYRIVILLFLVTVMGYSQSFSKQDSLFGSITPERGWWDLKHYELEVSVFPKEREITGTNTITYTVLDPGKVMQLDLQKPMKLLNATQDGEPLDIRSEGMFHFITLKKKQKKGKTYSLSVQFSGKPRVAKNPPWDGGFTWSRDSSDQHFIATSNQGIGASIWWPNKDHPYDEPDNGVDLAITVPSELSAVGNGRLVEIVDNEDTRTWKWKVVNPINNYGVNVNIADYVRFSEKFKGEKGELDLDYWVLRESEEKANRQFSQVSMTIEAFEHWFGPYPFYEDSFKLVEVPYLGMEHQSSVTYGNRYSNGYLGMDLSGTGWGMKFDFIIIHESGHEWFANNITNDDVSDIWIHEGFTAYSENLYLDYHFGKEASSAYVVGTRKSISNDRPIIGIRGVRKRGSGDMYYKGANILHTLRQLLEDDEKWREILRGLNSEFRHQTVSSKQVEDYISEMSGIDLTEFWQQYLRTVKIPKVEFKIVNNELSFRYTDIIEEFDMPVIAIVNGKEHWLFPKDDWKAEEFDEDIRTFKIKRDFYVNSEEIKE